MKPEKIFLWILLSALWIMLLLLLANLVFASPIYKYYVIEWQSNNWMKQELEECLLKLPFEKRKKIPEEPMSIIENVIVKNKTFAPSDFLWDTYIYLLKDDKWNKYHCAGTEICFIEMPDWTLWGWRYKFEWGKLIPN